MMSPASPFVVVCVRRCTSALIALVLLAQGCAHAPSQGRGADAHARHPSSEAQSRSEAAFVRGAVWALLLTYDDDADDPSLLLASLHQLQDDESLARLRGEWQEPLSLGLARAHELQRLAPQLRALRRAFAEAFVDELTGHLTGVDASACRQGLLPPADGGDTDDSLVVTLEPLGPRRLATLRRLCRSRARPPAAEPAPSQTLRWPSSAQGPAPKNDVAPPDREPSTPATAPRSPMRTS